MSKAHIHLIDDDDAIRKSLSFLLKTEGYSVDVYETATAFLNRDSLNAGDCIITDVRMPEISGLQLIRTLKSMGVVLPIIVVTGHGDIAIAVEAMKAGACDFLEKPFASGAVLRAVKAAIDLKMSQHVDDLQRQEVLSRLAALTERERQVMKGIVGGGSNKEVARSLGISPRTVDIYRANVMIKMRAESLPDLVRLAIVAGF